MPCLLAARDGEKPKIFCTLVRIDIVHRMYKKMNEHSVKSVPCKFLCDKPWIHEIGVNGNRATTFPSKIELNIERSAVNAKPVKNL